MPVLEFNQNNAYIGLLIIMMILIVNFTLIIILFNKNKKLSQKQIILNKLFDKDNVEDVLLKCIEQQKQISDELIDIKNEILKIDDKQRQSLDQVGLVRYSVSNDTQAKLSYSLGVTNKARNGFVITGLYYRQGVNIYVKALKDGISDIPLSTEEQEAVNRAVTSK